MSRIVLASGSPRRQELLNRIGITDFDIRVPQTDEHYLYVLYLQDHL